MHGKQVYKISGFKGMIRLTYKRGYEGGREDEYGGDRDDEGGKR